MLNKCMRDVDQASLAAISQQLAPREDISQEVSATGRTPCALLEGSCGWRAGIANPRGLPAAHPLPGLLVHGPLGAALPGMWLTEP